MFEIFNLYENILKINYASSFFFLPLEKNQLNFALFYTALTCSPLEQFALKVEGCSQTTWKVVFYQNKQPAPGPRVTTLMIPAGSPTGVDRPTRILVQD